MAKCKITLTFPYDGDAETEEAIKTELKQDLIDGNFGIEDLYAAGNCNIEVEVLDNQPA